MYGRSSGPAGSSQLPTSPDPQHEDMLMSKATHTLKPAVTVTKLARASGTGGRA